MPGPFAAGIATQLRASKESVWGTPPAVGTGALYRRKTFDLATDKDAYQSAELLPHYQLADLRHGQISSKGTWSFEPSPGAHSPFFASALRKAFVAGATSGALVNVTATVGAPHFVRAAGSWLTDGFKIGDVIRWTGWATTGVPNNSRNYIITALTALNMTVVDPGSVTATVAAKASGDSVTVTAFGKKSFIPTTAHTDESWAFERFYSDITQGELFNGCKINGFSLKYAAGAMGDGSFPIMGAGYTNAAAQYYTAPTAASTTGVLAGANAGMLVAGSAIAYIRELSIQLDNGITPVPVIGSNNIQGLVQGVMKVTGSLTAYFQDATMRDYFLNESNVSLVFAAFTGTSLTADFIQVCAPNVKFLNADKPDGAGVIAMPMQFQALYNGSGGTGISSEQTTLSMQDSLA
jgi:hypothetical protein